MLYHTVDPVVACSTVDAPSCRHSPKLLWHAELADADTVRLAVTILFAPRRNGRYDVRCRRRRLLMAVATDDWRTFTVLACSRGEAALSDDTVAKCREASRLLTEWNQMPR